MKARNLICLASLVFGVLGGGCSDDGASMHGDGGIVPPAARKRVFYFRNGTLGKIRDSADPRPALEVADADCTEGASQMDLGGSWKAWLSSSQIDAIDRISDVGPWYRVDRETLLFASKSDLTRGPRARIDPGDWAEPFFWSGTALNGRRTPDTCQDWTVYNAPAAATVGRVDAQGEAWVASEPLLCSYYLALLCIEQ